MLFEADEQNANADQKLMHSVRPWPETRSGYPVGYKSLADKLQ